LATEANWLYLLCNQNQLKMNYKDAWLILSKENIVINVCSTEEIANNWKEITLFGYYSDCLVKKATENVKHWSERIDDNIESLKTIK